MFCLLSMAFSRCEIKGLLTYLLTINPQQIEASRVWGWATVNAYGHCSLALIPRRCCCCCCCCCSSLSWRRQRASIDERPMPAAATRRLSIGLKTPSWTRPPHHWRHWHRACALRSIHSSAVGAGTSWQIPGSSSGWSLCSLATTDRHFTQQSPSTGSATNSVLVGSER